LLTPSRPHRRATSDATPDEVIPSKAPRHPR
jgi:hypothetical protein